MKKKTLRMHMSISPTPHTTTQQFDQTILFVFWSQEQAIERYCLYIKHYFYSFCGICTQLSTCHKQPINRPLNQLNICYLATSTLHIRHFRCKMAPLNLSQKIKIAINEIFVYYLMETFFSPTVTTLQLLGLFFISPYEMFHN